MSSTHVDRMRRLDSLFWLLGGVLALYVALATPYRSEVLGSDAWEHHRAIRVLAQQGWYPGNPTYATEEPSVRYSPYSATLALISRLTGWSAYDVLSGGAVASTAMLVISMWVFLRSYGRQRIALPVLLVTVLLYGESPGYANSLALADLPWHQVNPSAFATPICLFLWALWRWSALRTARLLAAWPVCVVLLTVAVLSHPMTGILGCVGLMAVALAERGRTRTYLAIASVSAGMATIAIGMMWPLFSLYKAISVHGDLDWYGAAPLRQMLTVWCSPCLVAALLALPYRRDPLVRCCLWGMSAIVVLTGVAVLTRSAALVRLPLAGLVFAQVLVGYAAWRLGLLTCRGWRRAIRGLRKRHIARFHRDLVTILLPVAIVFFGLPQFLDIVRKPHLLREPVARLLGRQDKQPRYYERYRFMLEEIGERDVVMGERLITWPVPSFAGRVVAALHPELFTPCQMERWDDVARFFEADTSDRDRIDLLRKYNVSWILMREESDHNFTHPLIEPQAIHIAEDRDDRLVLMRAADWIAARD